MESYIIELLERIDRIYTLYERYACNHKNTEISVIIGDNSISFYLNGSNNLNDEFIISFNEIEGPLYHYLSLEVLAIVLGNVYVHQDENILYNNIHKSYVKMYINDEDILSIMKPILSNQDKEFIHKNMNYLNNARNLLLKFHHKKYDKVFLQQLDTRIDIVKKVLTR